MILQIIFVLLAIPVGFLIAYLARDELIIGRKYFRILIILGALGKVGFWIYGYREIALTCLFIAIIALISYIKSFDKKFAKI